MSVVLLFAAAAVMASIEARREAYDSAQQWRREVRVSLALGVVALAVELALPGGQQREPLSASAVTILIVFLADDFLYFVSHLLAHRIGVFWASHAVHHSPVRYDFFTGLRQPPTWILTPAAVAPLLLVLLGAPALLVGACASVRALHHFLIHTERIRRLPAWVEFIFNTPSHHRAHHGAEAACLDRNFGGVLILWDRLFDTFVPEPQTGVRQYGLVHPINGGVWETATEPWRRLFERVGHARTLSARLIALLLPPAAPAPPTAAARPPPRRSAPARALDPRSAGAVMLKADPAPDCRCQAPAER